MEAGVAPSRRLRTQVALTARASWALWLLGAFLVAVLAGPIYILLDHAFEGGWAAWDEFFNSPAKIDGLLRTLVIAAETAALCAVIGYAYAGVMVRARPAVRTTLMAIVVLPFLTSLLVRTYGWIVLLGNEGPIAQGIDSLGGTAPSLLYNRTGLMIGMVHVLLPFFVLPLYSVWSQIPPTLPRAARTLGANRVEAFLRVELPMSLPGAAAGAILVFITALGFFITPALLGGQADMMISQLIDRELTVSIDLNDAAVLGVVLLAAVLVALAVFRAFYPLELLFVPESKRTASSRQVPLARRVRRFVPRGMRWAVLRTRLALTAGLSRLPWTALVWAIVASTAVYLLAPLVVVIPISLTGESYLHFPPDSLSLRWFESVINDPGWRRAAYNSLLTGAIASALTLAIGLPAAFALARGRISTRLKGAILFATTLPVIVPLVVLALAIYGWLLELQLLGNQFALAAAHATLGLPFLVVIVTAALRDFDIRVERAARSLGASATTTLRLITLPLMKRAILAGLLFAFLQSFDELLIARAVTNVDTETLPVKLWNGANQEISPALGAVSVLSIALTVVAVIVAAGARRVRDREEMM